MVFTQEGESLYAEAYHEAEKHRWIESEKHGQDLGERAILEWYRRYWRAWVRHCHLEHLGGRRCWREFQDYDFGSLYSLILQGDLLVDRILDRLGEGCENLDVLEWAGEWGLPMERVIDILMQVDINRARLDPHEPLAWSGRGHDMS